MYKRQIRVTAKPMQTFPYKEGGGRPDPYFTGRCLSDETVRRFGLVVENGYAVLPVFAEGVCRSVCRRAIDQHVEPRYKNSRGAMQLWNSAAMDRAAGEALFVTEGIFDALSLEELGFPAVALCGAANTGRLMQALAADVYKRQIAILSVSSRSGVPSKGSTKCPHRK